jgi:hypothetical protein
VKDALPDDTFWQEARGYLEAMWSDMVTPAGLPILTISRDGYGALTDAAADLVPVEWVRDILNYDAVEVVQGIVPIVPLILGWNEKDADKFAMIVGSLGVGTVVAANPIAAVVAVLMIARGIHNSGGPCEAAAWAAGIAKGGSLTGVCLLVSSIVGGPVWVGLLAGTAIGIFLSRQLDEIDPADVSSFLQCRLQALAPAMAEPLTPP